MTKMIPSEIFKEFKVGLLRPLKTLKNPLSDMYKL